MTGGGLFFGLFFAVWLAMMAATVGGLIMGISAVVSALRLPPEAFGPWWDNTKSAWLIGLAVSFLIPFGLLISGIMWFASGKKAYNATGQVGRPFWIGPSRPSPAGWHADPTGQHELRFWDGAQWTGQVSDHGLTSQEPPQR